MGEERFILFNHLNSMWLSYAIQAAVHYDVATHLGDEKKTTQELAELTATNEAMLYRLLRFLAAKQIFNEVERKTFVNTPASGFLRRDCENTLYWVARMQGSSRYRQEWGMLEEVLRTGKMP